MTERTRVVLPVHFGGHPCDLPALRRLRDEKGWLFLAEASS